MSFITSEVNSCAVIAFEGKVVGGPDAVSLNEKLHEFISMDKTNVIMDLGKVKFMNSSGLGMLISSLTTLRKAGGDLRIANHSEKIKELLEITQLAAVFKQYPSVEEAVKSFES
jgi:anti-sigma B factor antagonist